MPGVGRVQAVPTMIFSDISVTRLLAGAQAFLAISLLTLSSFGAAEAGSLRKLQAAPSYASTHIRTGLRIGGSTIITPRLSGWSYAYVPGRGYITFLGQWIPIQNFPYQVYPMQPGTNNYALWVYGQPAYNYRELPADIEGRRLEANVTDSPTVVAGRTNARWSSVELDVTKTCTGETFSDTRAGIQIPSAGGNITPIFFCASVDVPIDGPPALFNMSLQVRKEGDSEYEDVHPTAVHEAAHYSRSSEVDSGQRTVKSCRYYSACELINRVAPVDASSQIEARVTVNATNVSAELKVTWSLRGKAGILRHEFAKGGNLRRASEDSREILHILFEDAQAATVAMTIPEKRKGTPSPGIFLRLTSDAQPIPRAGGKEGAPLEPGFAVLYGALDTDPETGKVVSCDKVKSHAERYGGGRQLLVEVSDASDLGEHAYEFDVEIYPDQPAAYWDGMRRQNN
eukprot:Polyplicarium_translucidae@DN3348_c1_g1_i2.p1